MTLKEQVVNYINTYKGPLRHSWLLQRLQAPVPHPEVSRVFGNSNVLMTPDAWKLLDEICSVDYMGAAEYEGSGISESIYQLGKWREENELTSFAILIAPDERTLNYDRKYKLSRGLVCPPAKTVCVYGICNSELNLEIQQRVRMLCAYEHAWNIKRGAKLDVALDPNGADPRHLAVGWLDLRNRFLFFVDENIWRNFCRLFSLEPCAVPAKPAAPDFASMKKPQLIQYAINFGMFANKTQAGKVPAVNLCRYLQESCT